ncbi:MAG: patatin-like phospholipase family protein [Pseudomonadales bacterium]
MRRALTTFAALVLALTLTSPHALAAPDAKRSDGPRVGLVLSGGGARGLAHIGVIKYLEEHNIRVHAIAGTSMGSVIGGMYASGMNAAQLEQVARNLDWRGAFDDATPRHQQNYRRKREDFDFLIDARLRFKDGKLGIPMGAIEGQRLNLILHDLVKQVADITDFDQLPIPYRAVASDIVTGDPVILRQGDLAVAMRASMSIPGVFTPIELDGHLLVDGGIAKNIPVDVVQDMGVDRLIVIDIGTPLAPRDKLGNVLALMDQLTTIMTRKNSEQQIAKMRPGDVLITPAMDAAGVETMSFDKADEAIQLGYEAAQALAPQLATLAAPGRAEQVVGITEEPPPRIDSVRIETDAKVSEELLRSRITQPLGQPFDRDRIERDVANIYGYDLFSRVDYEVRPSETSNELVLRAIANPRGVDYLKLGMSWDQDSRGTSEFGLRASWHQRAVNRLGAEWYSFVQIGGDSNLGTEFYQPLDPLQRFFVEARYRFEQRRVHFSEDEEIRARAAVDEQLIELATGVNLGDAAQFRGGVYAATATTDIEIGDPTLSSNSANDGGWFAELGYDSLDRPYFPSRGNQLRSRYSESNSAAGADAVYNAWSSLALTSFSFGRNSFIALGRWSQLDLADSSSEIDGAKVLPQRAYTLGGFLALSGYTQSSLAGNTMGFAGLTYYRRLTDQSILPVNSPVYAGFSLEAGNTWLEEGEASLDDLLYAGSVYLGIDSPIGPVYMGIGAGEHSQYALFLKIGQILDR